MHNIRRRMLPLAAVGGLVSSARLARAQTPIPQPASPGPRAFMDRAFELAQQAGAAGDGSFGAVIVRGERIVGEAPSRVRTSIDPTAHAEIEAIRDAARRLGTADLSGCTMYGSFRPCPMCETAAMWARIDRFHFGRDVADGGAPRSRNC